MLRALFFIFALSVSGWATAYDGKALLELAKSHDLALASRANIPQAVEAAKLIGYVSALTDEAALDQIICLPEGVSYEQLTEIAKKFIRSKPTLWHLPGHLLVQISLKEAFPCKPPIAR